MTAAEFKSKMLYAESMKKLDDRPDYWAGYIRGLRRKYHGENFGTSDEHEKWMSLIYDETRSDMGRGYRDALGEMTIKPQHCLRCGHDWKPRSLDMPTICPKCKSPYWNKPRKDKITE